MGINTSASASQWIIQWQDSSIAKFRYSVYSLRDGSCSPCAEVVPGVEHQQTYDAFRAHHDEVEVVGGNFLLRELDETGRQPESDAGFTLFAVDHLGAVAGRVTIQPPAKPTMVRSTGPKLVISDGTVVREAPADPLACCSMFMPRYGCRTASDCSWGAAPGDHQGDCAYCFAGTSCCGTSGCKGSDCCKFCTACDVTC